MKIKKIIFPTLSQEQLIFFVALWLTIFYNTSMFSHIVDVYPLQRENILYVASTFVVHVAVTTLFFALLATRYTIKPILICVLLVSSVTAYFMNKYDVVIDENMIRNAIQTDIDESFDLLSLKLVGYFLFLGVLPSYIVYKTPLQTRDFKSALWARIKILLFLIVLAFGTVALFGKFYASFFREHKILRFYANPGFWIDSLRIFVQQSFEDKNTKLQVLGVDAKIEDNQTRKIVFMVVGEAARADHFSLNGYQKETNPKLHKEDIVNFSQMYSCGTSTAYSVPCMFSIYNRSDYSYKKAKYTENVLDVLKHTKDVAILWRDNNSDSKGVATRVEYQDFKTPKNNPICDVECRDIGMLEGLDQFIAKHPKKNILIVLHQMGNHGPAYYKRYTKKFEKFTPVCNTNQLEECSKESVANGYDNALLYSDNFLAATIDFAKHYTKSATAVLYMSDHGESLGEHGIYLHGLPYFIAPDAQKHIGSFLWLNERYKQLLDTKKIEAKKDKELSHDYLFHTLLGLFGVKTKVYDPKLDIVH
ncbi:Probable integral membrane protein [hydrothermal vent metagenome]|uniref:Probable integral membrane protein n=1 Tax=hydrothermal vent metagenome TaxID=652676 RepID=A0A1W1E9V8_9ZZZZ